MPCGRPTSSVLISDPHIRSATPSRKYASPIVAMKRMIGSWLTRCRNTNRFTAQANPAITTTVSRMAASAGTCQPKLWTLVPNTALMRWLNGTCPFWMPTSVIAANSAMTPCA